MLGRLRRYLGLLQSVSELDNPGVPQLMGQHILDLCSRLTSADDDRSSPSAALRAARRLALKDDICRNLSGDVSARALAIRQFGDISTCNRSFRSRFGETPCDTRKRQRDGR